MEFSRAVVAYMQWVRLPDPDHNLPNDDTLHILGGSLSAAGAEAFSEALESRIEEEGRWTFPDRSVVMLAPWLKPQSVVRLFGDRTLVGDAARRARQAAEPQSAPEDEGSRPEVELLSRLIANRGSSRVAAVARWLTTDVPYDRLVLFPEAPAAACRILLEAASRSGSHFGGAALQRLTAARVSEPVNHYLRVRGLYFQSASSLQVSRPGLTSEQLRKLAEQGLLRTDWETWWARSRSGPRTSPPGTITEFDFWPLVVDGKAPTKVRLAMTTPEPVPGSQGLLVRIPVQLLDDGANQLAGKAHWLLDLTRQQPGPMLRIHSVFDQVYPAANYRTDWQVVSRVSWHELNLDRVFGQMHVWVEDNEGPFPLVQRVDQELRGMLMGALDLGDHAQRSGLPGLADWIQKQVEAP